MEKKILKVEGMSCEHCVKAVTNAIGGIAGVANVAVSLKDKTATFEYDVSVANAPTILNAIKSAIMEEGFEVGE